MKSERRGYPRPLLMRDEWSDLCGKRDFALDDGNAGLESGWSRGIPASEAREIVVPFAYQTKMSGIADESYHPYVWYSREIAPDWEQIEGGKRLLIHFEGADFFTSLWVNGCHAGDHRGGYSRFSFDITSYLQKGKENRIVARCEDAKDPSIPRGKQRWAKESYACWYVETTGIWKAVWMEYVPALYIESIKITPCLQSGTLEADFTLNRESPVSAKLSVKVRYGDDEITAASTSVKARTASLVLQMADFSSFEWGIHKWSPDDPSLYDLEIALESPAGKDAVSSYAAMREISIDRGRILLNGEALYQRLILDQGYWPNSGLTPPSLEALEDDIDKILKMGFNGLRKHQKIEDERFLYLCDKKGVLVWSEMAAAYTFSDEAAEEFAREWMEIVRQNYSHPCIVTWTPFNESWGVGSILRDKKQQAFTEAIYQLTKAFDQTRPVIVNDGWEHTVSDILTLHDYEEEGEALFSRYKDFIGDILAGKMEHNNSRKAIAEGYEYRGQPIIISEYGDIAFSGRGEGWGYGNKVSSEESFIRRFDAVTIAIKKLPFVQGYCYTQVSDVEQEVNGLLTPLREFKVNCERIAEINKRRVGGR